MAESGTRALLDTNVWVSAFVYGGRPRLIVEMLHDKRFVAVTSPVLVSELLDVLAKKFRFSRARLRQAEKKVKKLCSVVHPDTTLNVSRDEADNRVLEAAVSGSCNFIVTGDSDLLDIEVFRDINIVNPAAFLEGMGAI